MSVRRHAGSLKPAIRILTHQHCVSPSPCWFTDDSHPHIDALTLGQSVAMSKGWRYVQEGSTAPRSSTSLPEGKKEKRSRRDSGSRPGSYSQPPKPILLCPDRADHLVRRLLANVTPCPRWFRPLSVASSLDLGGLSHRGFATITLEDNRSHRLNDAASDAVAAPDVVVDREAPWGDCCLPGGGRQRTPLPQRAIPATSESSLLRYVL